MAIKEGGVSRKAFNIFNYVFLFLLMVVCLYPLYLQFIISISHGLEVMKGGITLLPRNVTLATYRAILRGDLFMYMKNSIIYTVVGTAVNLFMSCLCAYPLSRRTFSGRRFFTAMVSVTLFFGGGMIPMYLTVKQFDLMDTMWALILPGAISTYNMIIIRTAFQSIPDSLVESAQLDGATDLTILWKIVIPLSKATLATMLLFYAVSHWNSYFDAMLYINKKELYPLQIMLRNMLIGGQLAEETEMVGSSAASFATTDATLRAGTIIVSTLPILIVYPFVQRHFVKGVMVGSIKG
ncbi:MAG: carbohydrate ABC transporter permease [Clostridia bacterium]|nr:carbohydrate ABC transporter permease [Clostridia bacterium]